MKNYALQLQLPFLLLSMGCSSDSDDSNPTINEETTNQIQISSDTLM